MADARRAPKVITVRNLPPRVARAIARKARDERRSLNQTVVSLLETATGAVPASPRGAVHEDLDHLFGVWSKREADEFDAELKRSRSVIDPKDWE